MFQKYESITIKTRSINNPAAALLSNLLSRKDSKIPILGSLLFTLSVPFDYLLLINNYFKTFLTTAPEVSTILL